MGTEPPFAKFPRKLIPVRTEIDWKPRTHEPDEDHIHQQASRCTDCGIPFCEHACPLGNEISDFNAETRYAIERVRQSPYDELAFSRLVETIAHTNNFPEWTGTMCPAPCEDACVHAVVGDAGAWGAVTIKDIEHFIADRQFVEGLRPWPIETNTGKSVAVVGSGPAGLAAAQQLKRSGHDITVFERDDAIGGLIRFGIPDFKFDKRRIDLRVAQMAAEGVRFVTRREVTNAAELMSFDCVILATGMREPRDLKIPGRELGGVHLAMDYLTAQNRALRTKTIESDISAEGHVVIVIGGGDTGDDCVGVALRQRAQRVIQFQHGIQPPIERRADIPWPLPSTSWKERPSLEEGGEILFSTAAFQLVGVDGYVQEVNVSQPSSDGTTIADVYKSSFVVIATGFRGIGTPLVSNLELKHTPDGKIWRDEMFRAYSPVVGLNGPAIFVCGDAARGPSLIVWAIAEGRSVASAVDRHLMGRTVLNQPLDAGQTLDRMM